MRILSIRRVCVKLKLTGRFIGESLEWKKGAAAAAARFVYQLVKLDSEEWHAVKIPNLARSIRRNAIVSAAKQIGTKAR